MTEELEEMSYDLMDTEDRVQFVLFLARKGELGSPQVPNRGSSGKCAFWNTFDGMANVDFYKDTLAHDYAMAGRLYREEIGGTQSD